MDGDGDAERLIMGSRARSGVDICIIGVAPQDKRVEMRFDASWLWNTWGPLYATAIVLGESEVGIGRWLVLYDMHV
jgi:hypothetical protein